MPNPTRPVQDAIIDPVWGQWVHDKTAAFAFKKVTGTSDAWGYLHVSAATLGLTSVTGAVASIANDPMQQNLVNAVGAVVVTPTSVAIQLWKITMDTNDADIHANVAGVAVTVFAYGTSD